MPEIEQKTFQKRQVAYKVRVSDILNRIFVKDELSAGYVKINNNNVSRINIIATIVFKSEDPNSTSALIDDGTGRILLRTFERKDIFSNVDVGDVVLLIGKIREFNNEKYIMPEVLKKITDNRWIGVRNAELKNSGVEEKVDDKIPDSGAELVNENEKIYLLIRKLDHGDGAPIEEVLNSYSDKDAEKIVNRLMENGDIFEIKPGRIKVLE